MKDYIMKRLWCIIFLLLVTKYMYAYNSDVVEAYIEKYKAIALTNEKEYGIPAPIILAQGILE